MCLQGIPSALSLALFSLGASHVLPPSQAPQAPQAPRLRLVPGVRRQLRGRVHPKVVLRSALRSPLGRAARTFGKSPASRRPPSDRCRRQGPVACHRERLNGKISPKVNIPDVPVRAFQSPVTETYEKDPPLRVRRHHRLQGIPHLSCAAWAGRRDPPRPASLSPRPSCCASPRGVARTAGTPPLLRNRQGSVSAVALLLGPKGLHRCRRAAPRFHGSGRSSQWASSPAKGPGLGHGSLQNDWPWMFLLHPAVECSSLW